MIQRLQAWLSGLSTRERVFVLGAMPLVLVMVIYGGAWLPLNKEIERLQRQAEAAQANLAWMRSAAERVEAIAQRAEDARVGADGPSAVIVVDRTARAARINISSTRPEGEQGVRVTLDPVAFDAMLRWLSTLAFEHGITVSSASITRKAEPGLVQARLSLERRSS